MPSIYSVKPLFQKSLRPLVRLLARIGVTANQVTLLACALSITTGILLIAFRGRPRLMLILPLFFFLRMAMNAIDGMLAREFGQSTPIGAYLNKLADVLSDTALYLPFAFVAPFGPWSVGLVVFAACISEMAGALGPLAGTTRRHDGPMGKSDRALVFGALGLCVGLGGPLPPVFFWTMPAIALLICCNIVNRVCRGATAAPGARR